MLAGLDAVTAEDIQRVAQDVVGKQLKLAVIGPFDDAERFERLLLACLSERGSLESGQLPRRRVRVPRQRYACSARGAGSRRARARERLRRSPYGRYRWNVRGRRSPHSKQRLSGSSRYGGKGGIRRNPNCS